MVVELTKTFFKEIHRKLNKQQATRFLKKLYNTTPSDGKYVALVKDVMIRERKLDSFRFYFIQKNLRIEIMTEQELKKHLLKFVALSKKNNQQYIIDKLKDELKSSNLRV